MEVMAWAAARSVPAKGAFLWLMGAGKQAELIGDNARERYQRGATTNRCVTAVTVE